MRMLDTFAGAGGWEVAARNLGWADIDRVENWAPANATAEAAGFGAPVALDVRDYHTEPGRHDLQTHSPSCRTFAISGKGEGRAQLNLIRTAVRWIGDGSEWRLAGIHPDAALTLEPLRLILQGMPRAVALEQAPSVLPIWVAYADVMRDRGYAVWVGVVSSEQYGVPQIRKRAALLARRDRAAIDGPVPTHSAFYPRDPGRLDPGVAPWVSMADALGWGMTKRPSMTVTGGGSYTGGAEPFGNAARQGMLREMELAGHWAFKRPSTTVLGDPRIAAPGHRDRSSDGERHHARSIRCTPEECATLQTFPEGYPFQGNKGERHQQIGNAVPPLLAEALLKELLP
jgi:DNA (cytosine-5)-methyltransferase 1